MKKIISSSIVLCMLFMGGFAYGQGCTPTIPAAVEIPKQNVTITDMSGAVLAPTSNPLPNTQYTVTIQQEAPNAAMIITDYFGLSDVNGNGLQNVERDRTASQPPVSFTITTDAFGGPFIFRVFGFQGKNKSLSPLNPCTSEPTSISRRDLF